MKGKVLNLFNHLRDLIVVCLLVFITAMPVVEIIFHFDELRHGLFELVAEEDSKEKEVIEGESENEEMEETLYFLQQDAAQDQGQA